MPETYSPSPRVKTLLNNSFPIFSCQGLQLADRRCLDSFIKLSVDVIYMGARVPSKLYAAAM